MEQLLKAKPLQLFVTIYCPKIISLIIQPKIYLILLSLSILQLSFLLGYFYYLGSALKNQLSTNVTISNRFFNICLIFSFIFLSLKNFTSYLPMQYQNRSFI